MNKELQEAYKLISSYRGKIAKKKLGRQHYVEMGKKSGIARKLKTAKNASQAQN